MNPGPLVLLAATLPTGPQSLPNLLPNPIFRFLFAWIGDWHCVRVAFCNKPRRMLYALSVIGIGVSMISKMIND